MHIMSLVSKPGGDYPSSDPRTADIFHVYGLSCLQPHGH